MCFLGTPIYAAGLDDPVYSHLAVFANAFRVRGSTIIVYIYCKCMLQTFSKFLALVNCVHAFATMIYHPPSANPAVYSKLLDVVIHLAAIIGTIIHKYATTTVKGEY